MLVNEYIFVRLLQLPGDLDELLASIQGTVDPFGAGSCSALVKVLDGNSDIYVSHDTWTSKYIYNVFVQKYL